MMSKEDIPAIVSLMVAAALVAYFFGFYHGYHTAIETGKPKTPIVSPSPYHDHGGGY